MSTAKRKPPKGRPFAKGDDPRRNLSGRPRGKTIKEALVLELASEGITGASEADEIARALIKKIKAGDVSILDRVLMLTEDVKPGEGNTAHVLITLDR